MTIIKILLWHKDLKRFRASLKTLGGNYQPLRRKNELSPENKVNSRQLTFKVKKRKLKVLFMKIQKNSLQSYPRSARLSFKLKDPLFCLRIRLKTRRLWLLKF